MTNISAGEAWRLISSAVTELEGEEVELKHAMDRVAFDAVRAQMPIPSFDNSAMDGFAVKSEETKDASATHPVVFNIIGSIFAGDAIMDGVESRRRVCHQINTGAPFPSGYDACVRVEDAKIVDDLIYVSYPVRSGLHKRHIGEDFEADTTLLQRGTVITPEHLMALASQGLTRLRVFRRPKIAILCTGKELADNGEELKSGQIYNTNSVYLESCLSAWNYPVDYLLSVKDDAERFQQVLDTFTRLHRFDVIISTGAVSKGKADFIGKTLQGMNAHIQFHGVRTRPGHPMLFALVEHVPLFALPGNPSATAACLRFFVEPYLRLLHGRQEEKPIQAQLLCDVTKRHDVMAFRKAGLVSENGEVHVYMEEEQLGNTRSLIEANAWAILPEGRDHFEHGTLISVYKQHPTYDQ